MEIGSREWRKIILDSSAALNLPVTDSHTEQFGIHARELLKWNEKINLTSVTDPCRIAVRHFTDSLVCLPFIPTDGALLDIGSGGGFPGIPLKIMLPSLSVTLIDASRKKVSFLNHIIRTLRLEKIRAVHIRAEELAQQCSGLFDAAVSRALSSLDAFVSLASPLISENGLMIALKGKMSKEEIDALHRLRLRDLQSIDRVEPFSVSVIPYILPGDDAERSVVCVKPN